jgi:hypothetical protein
LETLGSCGGRVLLSNDNAVSGVHDMTVVTIQTVEKNLEFEPSDVILRVIFVHRCQAEDITYALLCF